MTKARSSELLTPDSIQVKSGRLLRFCQVLRGCWSAKGEADGEASLVTHLLATWSAVVTFVET